MIVRNKGHFNLVPLPTHAWEVLREGVNKLRMEYWLTTGTLLGLYRDGKLIPRDTDLDVAVKGYEHIWADLVTRLSGFEVIRVVINHDKLQQIAFKRRDVIFDVFVYWARPNAEIYSNYGAAGRLDIPREVLGDLADLNTRYGLFTVPMNSDRYLTGLYGDWRVPRDAKPRYK
jgi:hypothetical protein